MKHVTPAACAIALILTLAACSPKPETDAGNNSAEANAMATAEPVNAVANAVEPAAAANILALEGLGALKIGAPVPEGSGWSKEGAQASDTCLTYSSAAYPDTYAIVEDGKVRRISVMEGSPVKLIEGIGPGASEDKVNAAFPGFKSEPHTYEEAPAKYLTAPNAESGDPALRFEINSERKVSAIHVGTMPVLGYVEGCA